MSTARGSSRAWARAACAVAVAFALAGVLAPGGARADCTPIPLLVTCPPPPPPAVYAPVATITAATDVGERTATMNGTINPEGLVTDYVWTVEDAASFGEQTVARVGAVAAGYSAVPISTPVSGLEPGVTYTIRLEASNDKGLVDPSAPSAFTTVEHPILSVTSARSFYFGYPFTVTVHASGAYNPSQDLTVYAAKAPYRHWVPVGAGAPYDHGKLTLTPCPRAYLFVNRCEWLDRNFKVRATMGPSTSRARLVYVNPVSALTSSAAAGSPYLEVTFSLTVHTAARYPRPTAYFYRSATRTGTYTLVGARRLHPHREYRQTMMLATTRVHIPHADYVYACLRRPLFADMGARFVNRACGGRAIR